MLDPALQVVLDVGDQSNRFPTACGPPNVRDAAERRKVGSTLEVITWNRTDRKFCDIVETGKFGYPGRLCFPPAVVGLFLRFASYSHLKSERLP